MREYYFIPRLETYSPQAAQIFDVLRVIGAPHNFSAGCLIGGKDFESEAAVLRRMNILIGTPGRILHHMDQTPDFDCSNVKILGNKFVVYWLFLISFYFFSSR